MTAMSASTPSALPRSIVTVRMTGSGFPAMTSAASVGSTACVCRFSRACSCCESGGEPVLLLQLHLQLRYASA